ncbi:6884_t:CDS:2 [Diversispora eburnea]|uniref:6884_t:CDS:1 n=1 Tax=Diversispora eburnea TaxID=1213867 RepID=A0A9N8V342_9GLOM|nr:6884_t:CDS:2 [Diversispora eburnea]
MDKLCRRKLWTNYYEGGQTLKAAKDSTVSKTTGKYEDDCIVIGICVVCCNSLCIGVGFEFGAAVIIVDDISAPVTIS